MDSQSFTEQSVPQETISFDQPVSQIPTPPSSNWLKYLLIIISSIVIIVGLIFGIQLSKNKTFISQPLTDQINITSSQMINSPTEVPRKPGITTYPIADWKTYNISECLVRFKYPIEWQSGLSNKEHCQINYWQPTISSQPQDTFVIFDVQPEFFLGKQNIEIDPVKIIIKSQKDGIEKTIEYFEEKDKNRPLYLSSRYYFFKKGPIYFRILGQYKKGDNDFEKTLDKIAETVIFDGDESFYSNYIKNLENDLKNFAPQN